MSTKLKIAFDVSGTLSVPLVAELYKALDPSKCELIVWSSMGVEYCKDFCLEHNLTPHRIIKKHSEEVDIAVDDHPESIGNALVVLGVMG